jgi:hypothetical protein
VYRFLKDCYVLKHKCIEKVSLGNLHDDYVLYCTNQQQKPKGKIEFNLSLKNIGIVCHKSNGDNYFTVKLEQLKELAKKFNWVHELDVYTKQVTKNVFTKQEEEDEEEALEEGIDTSDQSVKITVIQEQTTETFESKHMVELKRLNGMHEIIQSISKKNNDNIKLLTQTPKQIIIETHNINVEYDEDLCMQYLNDDNIPAPEPITRYTKKSFFK